MCDPVEGGFTRVQSSHQPINDAKCDLDWVLGAGKATDGGGWFAGTFSACQRPRNCDPVTLPAPAPQGAGDPWRVGCKALLRQVELYNPSGI